MIVDDPSPRFNWYSLALCHANCPVLAHSTWYSLALCHANCPVLAHSTHPDPRYLAAPLALALCLAMFTLSLVVPSELGTEILLSLIFWAGGTPALALRLLSLSAMIGVTAFTMLKNGPDYVDQPKWVEL